MTILWIILVLMTMAFSLLYPVVAMTQQFRNECPEMPSFSNNSNQHHDHNRRENLRSVEGEPSKGPDHSAKPND